MAEQLALPLEFSDTPFTIVVSVDSLNYTFGTFATEQLARSAMEMLVRLLEEQVGVSLSPSSGSWYGTSTEVSGHGHMWSVYLTQSN